VRESAHAPRGSSRFVAGALVGDVEQCSARRQRIIALPQLIACALLVTLAVPRDTLRAQPTSPREDAMRAPTPPAEALEHYERGRREYLAGRYREALQELKVALALDPNSPNLVYNVARVNEDLADLDEAIKYYRRYHSLLPPAAHEERDKTEKTIRRLQGAKDEQTQQRIARERNAPPKRPSLPAPSAGRADVAFWLVAGTGLALAAGSGVTGVFALRREKAVGDFVLGKDGSFEKREKLRQQADELALASDVMSIGAGVAILSAIVLFFSRTSDSGPVEARVSVSPQAGGIDLRARF
jgi:tetratricopeptide (TPR) repeat protein